MQKIHNITGLYLTSLRYHSILLKLYILWSKSRSGMFASEVYEEDGLAARVLWLWFRFSGVNISLKMTTFSLFEDFLRKRTYLQLTKSEIIRILFSLNIQPEGDVCGLKSIILSAFSCKCSSLLKQQFVWCYSQISHAYIKWQLNIEWYIVLKRCLGT